MRTAATLQHPEGLSAPPGRPVMGEASYGFGRSQEQHQGFFGPFGLKWDNCALSPRPRSQPAFMWEGAPQEPGFTWFKAQVRAGASQAPAKKRKLLLRLPIPAITPH